MSTLKKILLFPLVLFATLLLVGSVLFGGDVKNLKNLWTGYIR